MSLQIKTFAEILKCENKNKPLLWKSLQQAALKKTQEGFYCVQKHQEALSLPSHRNSQDDRSGPFTFLNDPPDQCLQWVFYQTD